MIYKQENVLNVLMNIYYKIIYVIQKYKIVKLMMNKLKNVLFVYNIIN